MSRLLLKMKDIQSVFIRHTVLTHVAKDDVLRLLRTIKPETQKKLGKTYRSLTPRRLQYQMYDIPPGQMAYSGISNVLNFCKNKLYDPSKRTVRLSINIDGLPLYRSSKVDLWPILGRIEEKKIFPIAVYAGKKNRDAAICI